MRSPSLHQLSNNPSPSSSSAKIPPPSAARERGPRPIKQRCRLWAVLVAWCPAIWGCVPQVTLREDRLDAASDSSGAAAGNDGSAADGGDAAGNDDGPTGLDAAGGDAEAGALLCDQDHPDVCPAPSCPGGRTYHGDWDRSSPTSTVLTDVSTANVQNILAGASSDGNTILVQRGCGSDGSLWLYDGDLETRNYTGTDITNAVADLDLREGRITLAPDGLTLVANRLDTRGFQAKRRRDRRSTEFVNADVIAFVHVNDWALKSASEVWSPVLSQDGLSFFFIAHLTDDPVTLLHYEVTRARSDESFSRPDQLVPGMGVDQSHIWGVSADRLTLFAGHAVSWVTVVLVRPRLGAPFEVLDPPIPSIRTVPLGDGCDRLLGNATTAGCGNEEVLVLSR